MWNREGLLNIKMFFPFKKLNEKWMKWKNEFTFCPGGWAGMLAQRCWHKMDSLPWQHVAWPLEPLSYVIVETEATIHIHSKSLDSLWKEQPAFEAEWKRHVEMNLTDLTEEHKKWFNKVKLDNSLQDKDIKGGTYMVTKVLVSTFWGSLAANCCNDEMFGSLVLGEVGLAPLGVWFHGVAPRLPVCRAD